MTKKETKRWIIIILVGFSAGVIIGFLTNCTSPRPFPYIRKAELGKVRSSRVQRHTTFIQTDSAGLFIEGRKKIPAGETATYYRKYPNKYRYESPKVILVGKKQYKIKDN